MTFSNNFHRLETRLQSAVGRAIGDFKMIEDDKQGMICIYLKYDTNSQKSAITQLERISRPGRRTYVQSGALPRVRNGLGIAIISTSQGVMTDHQAGQAGIGGEHIMWRRSKSHGPRN